jgi:hypothetical protein
MIKYIFSKKILYFLSKIGYDTRHMNLAKPETTEERIISLLLKNSLSGAELLAILDISGKKITKQALYNVLRKLIQDEIVVKHAKIFSLSRLWLQNMANLFTSAQDRYGIELEKNDFLSIHEGDKISYTFKNPYEADQFWGHAFDILIDKTPVEVPIVLYNPHQWFLLVRTDSEYQLLERISKEGKKLHNHIGSSNALDRYVEKYFDLPGLQYVINEQGSFEARNYYINIFNNYIIEVYIDEKVAEEIDRFYEQYTDFDKIAEKKLQSIVSQGKTRLVISRNSKKADRLRALIEL